MCKGLLINVAYTEPVRELAEERINEARVKGERHAESFWLGVLIDLHCIGLIRVLEALGDKKTPGEWSDLHNAKAARQHQAAMFPELAPFDAAPYCIAHMRDRMGPYWARDWNRVVTNSLYGGPTECAAGLNLRDAAGAAREGE